MKSLRYGFGFIGGFEYSRIVWLLELTIGRCHRLLLLEFKYRFWSLRIANAGKFAERNSQSTKYIKNGTLVILYSTGCRSSYNSIAFFQTLRFYLYTVCSLNDWIFFLNRTIFICILKTIWVSTVESPNLAQLESIP